MLHPLNMVAPVLTCSYFNPHSFLSFQTFFFSFFQMHTKTHFRLVIVKNGFQIHLLPVEVLKLVSTFWSKDLVLYVKSNFIVLLCTVNDNLVERVLHLSILQPREEFSGWDHKKNTGISTEVLISWTQNVPSTHCFWGYTSTFLLLFTCPGALFLVIPEHHDTRRRKGPFILPGCRNSFEELTNNECNKLTLKNSGQNTSSPLQP